MQELRENNLEPLVEGGQGRSALEVMESARIVCFCMAGMTVLIAVVLAVLLFR